LDWLDDQAEKSRIISLLKERVATLHALEQQLASNAQPQASTAAASESSSATTTSVFSTADDEDFFALLRAKRQAQQSEQTRSPADDPRQEVDKFFRGGAAGLVSLKEYPYIKKLYVTLITGLPSSASVEWLFSLGGRIFTPSNQSINQSVVL